MKSLPKTLHKRLSDRAQNNALRSLPSTSTKVDFYSNDYLGFAQNPQIKQNALDLEEQFPNKLGATGSRLISGNHDLYNYTEAQIAQFHHTPKALLFNSGYNANVGLFASVPQRGDVVFYDEYIHASIREGMQISLAKNYNFKHNSLGDLQAKLTRIQPNVSGVIYVVIEAVYSMDGDCPDLKAFTQFCDENDLYLIVDEAHSIGVYGNQGEGLVQYLGLQDSVFAQVITFGKSLGCHGAVVLCNEDLYSYLVNFARSLIYTTALPPSSVAVISAGYSALSRLPQTKEQEQLKECIQIFKQAIQNYGLQDLFIESDSAIHCCTISGNDKVKQVAKSIQDAGFEVKAILSPTVPKGEERLRFCLHSYNTSQQIIKMFQILVKALS